MSKKLLVITAVMLLLVTGSVFAAVDNIKVSGDIKATAVTRNLDLGGSGSNADAEDFLFSQVRLRIDADLTEGVSAVIRLINEKVWGETDYYNDAEQIELDLAYVQLNSFLYEPLTLVVGRQNLYYGNGLIVGDPDTNRLATKFAGNVVAFADLSLSKSFDAIKAVLDFSPYTIDIIYAKVTENDTNEIDDQTLVGINAAYQWASYNGITEAYAFWSDGRMRGSTQIDENEDYTLTVGARAQMDVNDNLTLGLEGAHQFGDYYVSGAEKSRDAWAGQFISEYRFLDELNSKIGLSYTYLSGDNDSGDDEQNAWDPMFEDQTPAEIINILFANSNLQYITLSGSIMPREDVTLKLAYTNARLVKDGVSSISGASGSANYGDSYSTNSDEKDVGNEIDLTAIYDYTEDVQLKLVGAVFMPGDLFADDNDSTAYSVRTSLNVEF